MSRRPSTRHHTILTPPPLSPTAEAAPETPSEAPIINKIKLRINRPPASVLAPASSDVGEPESSPPMTGRPTRARVSGRPNYREVLVDDAVSPVARAPSSTASSKYFTRAAAPVSEGETRRRVSIASGESGTSARNGRPSMAPGPSSRRSTRSHMGEEYEMGEPEQDAEEVEDFGESPRCRISSYSSRCSQSRTASPLYNPIGPSDAKDSDSGDAVRGG
jgi:hypothetical protein